MMKSPFDDVETDDSVQEDDAQVLPPSQAQAYPSPAIGKASGPNDQGLVIPSAPDAAAVLAIQDAANRAAAARITDTPSPVVDTAHFRGNHPVSGEQLFAHKGKTILRKAIPKGVVIEEPKSAATEPVV